MPSTPAPHAYYFRISARVLRFNKRDLLRMLGVIGLMWGYGVLIAVSVHGLPLWEYLLRVSGLMPGPLTAGPGDSHPAGHSFFSFVIPPTLIFLMHARLYFVRRRLALSLVDRKLTQTCPPIWGCGAAGHNWSLRIDEITQVTWQAAPRTDHPKGSTPVCLCLHAPGQPPRLLDPQAWQAVADAQALPALEDAAAPGAIDRSDAAAEAALFKHPLIRALQAQGLVIAAPNWVALRQQRGGFSSRSVAVGLLGGLGLYAFSLVCVINRKTVHFLFDFPLWVYPIPTLLACVLIWTVARRESPRPSKVGQVFAALFLGVGATLAAPQGLLLVNGWGLEATQEQDYVVEDGVLRPEGAQSGAGPIRLPVRYLSEGARVRVPVKKGRLGLWEYDDSRVRALAQ